MKMTSALNDILRKYGMELRRYPGGDLLRRIRLLDHFRINKIFDVGANSGQYAIFVRQTGFKGRIISFEPVSDAYGKLKKNSERDKDWTALNIAIGNFDGEAAINVSANSYSSSMFEMLPSHLKSAPGSVYIRKESVTVNKIDSLIGKYYDEGDNIFLKIDTQGYEKNVIDGAMGSMHLIRGVQMEMSLIPLYEGELLFHDMIRYMEDAGFDLWALESGFADHRTNRLLQVNGVFFRRGIKNEE